MNPTDAHLVAGFLIREFQSFYEYMDNWSIDPTEATLIVEELLHESNGAIPTCVQQLTGFMGDGK